MLNHLSINKIHKFYPRIPTSRIEGEDNSIKRICFSTDIKKALTSMPNGIMIAKNLIYLWKLLSIPPIMYLYTLDESTIDKKNIISTSTLARKGLVPDARIGKEVWVTNQEVICKETVIRIINIHTFIRKYASVGRNMLVVKDLDFEYSIEPFERTYPIKFNNAKQSKSIERLAIKLGYCVNRFNDKSISVHVPANSDIGLLWEREKKLKWDNLRAGYRKEYNDRQAPSIVDILSVNLQSIGSHE